MLCPCSSNKHGDHSTLENTVTHQEPIQDNTQNTRNPTHLEFETETGSSKNDKPIQQMLSVSPRGVIYSYAGRTYSKSSDGTFNTSPSKTRLPSTTSTVPGGGGGGGSLWSSSQQNTTTTSASTASSLVS